MDTWRTTQLAEHIVEWLPEFALAPSEWQGLQHANAVQSLRMAAKTVYESKKFERRGEFGELFLHAIIRQVHDSIPAISKIYYKTATNDTVKGFDAVHVVGPPDDMELWLGEAKFYDNISRAITDVVAELETHLGIDYLRTEFLLLKGKIDLTQPHAASLQRLFSPNTSLDEVFKRVCIPVLLTYDSDCVTTHKACTAEYENDFISELDAHYAAFIEKKGKKQFPTDVRIHLFLMPLHTKKTLVAELDRKLKTWQQL